MRKTKKITLSAMIVALGTVFMVIGGFVEVLDLSAAAIASVLVAFVYIELGSPYTWLVWIATALATFICFPGSVLWLEYLLVFGIYPILKAYIERLPRKLWILLKLGFINIVLWLVFAGFEFIFKTSVFLTDKLWMKIGLYVLLNVAFVAYDVFITVLVRFYLERLRPRFKHLLK